jgi:hypothetical protein
MKGKPIYS